MHPAIAVGAAAVRDASLESRIWRHSGSPGIPLAQPLFATTPTQPQPRPRSFPDSVLRPGEVYEKQVVYKFFTD